MDFNPALAALGIQSVEPVDLFPATQVDEDFAGPTADPLTSGPSNSRYVESTVVDGLAYSTDPFATQVFDAHDVTPTSVDGMANFAYVGEVTASGVAATVDPNTQVYQEDHKVYYNNFAYVGEVSAGVAAMADPNTQVYHDDMAYSNFACASEVTAGVGAVADPNTEVYHDYAFGEGWMGPNMQDYPDGGALGLASMGTMGNDFVRGNTWKVSGRSAATDPYEPFCGNDEYFLPPAPCSTPTALQHNVPATCAGPMVPLWQYLPNGDSQFISDDDLLNCYQEAAAHPCGLAGGSPEVVEVESGDEAVHPAVSAMTTNDEHKAAEAKVQKHIFSGWGWAVFSFQTKVERRWCAHMLVW